MKRRKPRWRGTATHLHSSAECIAKSWFEARDELMLKLGVGPGEIDVKPIEDGAK